MSKDTESMMITVPIEVRNKLRIMAAQKNLENPNQVTSAAEIARELLVSSLRMLRHENPEPRPQVKRFLNTCCRAHPHAIAREEEVVEVYLRWVESAHEEPLEIDVFLDEFLNIIAEDFPVKTDSAGVYIEGLEII